MIASAPVVRPPGDAAPASQLAHPPRLDSAGTLEVPAFVESTDFWGAGAGAGGGAGGGAASAAGALGFRSGEIDAIAHSGQASRTRRVASSAFV